MTRRSTTHISRIAEPLHPRGPRRARAPTRAARGFTLVELLLIIALLSIVSLLAVPRFGNSHHDASVQVDEANIAFINMQWEAQRITDGSYAQLNGLLGNEEYFPDGPPACPFDTAYQDADGDHRVDAHTH